MSKHVSMYLNPAQQRIVAQGVELGLGVGPGTVIQRLAAFAVFRFQGSSEPLVAASVQLEQRLKDLQQRVWDLQQQLRAVDATITAVFAASSAAEEAHLAVRAETDALARAAKLSQSLATGATP